MWALREPSVCPPSLRTHRSLSALTANVTPSQRAIAPTYESLAKQYEGNVTFTRADVDEALDLSNTYSIRSMPTFVVLRDGEQVEVQKGPSPTACANPIGFRGDPQLLMLPTLTNVSLQALVRKWAEETDRPGPTKRTPKELEAGYTDGPLESNQDRDEKRTLASGIASVVAAGLLCGVWLWFQEGLPGFGATSASLP